jgi:hypothetical protein
MPIHSTRCLYIIRRWLDKTLQTVISIENFATVGREWVRLPHVVFRNLFGEGENKNEKANVFAARVHALGNGLPD